MIESLRRQNIALFPFLERKTKRVPEKGNWPDKVQVVNQNAMKKMYQIKIEENIYYKEGKGGKLKAIR